MKAPAKEKDGLGSILWPFALGGLVLGALCTYWSGVRSAWAAPVFLGCWLGCFAGLVAAFIFVVWLVSLTVNMKKPADKKDHPFYRRLGVYVMGLLCRFARIRIHFDGKEKLPEGRFLLVSNHRSNYDPIATVWALRQRKMAFITKPENLRIPIAGPMIYKANYLPIDRENPRNAITTIQEASELLTKDIVSVGVYPEGTRGREEQMLPFHNGVFKIAQKADVPIAVVSVSGTEKIHKNFPLRPTDVYLRLCEVLPREELKSTTAEIGGRVRDILERSLAAGEPAQV